MDKSPEAFRTISEVAEALETPAHVLRFWESRFPQIRPVKRAGGRRYYRPSDVALLTGIKRLLHDEGMTIRGVQKILREQGIRHVSDLSEEVSPEEEALSAAMLGRLDEEPAMPPEEVEDETAAALQQALEQPAAETAARSVMPSPVEPTAAEPEPAEPPLAEPEQTTLDWLANLPAAEPVAEDRPRPSRPEAWPTRPLNRHQPTRRPPMSRPRP
ncbi:MAG: MerR family transcriptional regulator [Paracoccaceae bacterium]